MTRDRIDDFNGVKVAPLHINRLHAAFDRRFSHKLVERVPCFCALASVIPTSESAWRESYLTAAFSCHAKVQMRGADGRRFWCRRWNAIIPPISKNCVG